MKQIATTAETGIGKMPPAGDGAALSVITVKPKAVTRYMPDVYGKPQVRPATAAPFQRTMPPDPVIVEPVRGGEPKRIGELMEPVRRIIDHPDRNRLMADFFNRFW